MHPILLEFCVHIANPLLDFFALRLGPSASEAGSQISVLLERMKALELQNQTLQSQLNRQNASANFGSPSPSPTKPDKKMIQEDKPAEAPKPVVTPVATPVATPVRALQAQPALPSPSPSPTKMPDAADAAPAAANPSQPVAIQCEEVIINSRTHAKEYAKLATGAESRFGMI